MINRIRALALIFLLLFSPPVILRVSASTPEAGIKILDSTPRGMTLQFSPPELEVREREINNQTFTVLYSRGCAFTSEEGKPQIPTFSFTFGIPPDVKVEVNAAGFEPIRRQVGRICPTPSLKVVRSPNGEGRVVEHYKIDREFYAAPGPYPGKLAIVTELGYLRRSRMASLHIYPFRYYPATGELLTYQKIKIQISFRGKAPDTCSLPSRSLFAPILSQELINYTQARHFCRKPTFLPLRKQVAKGPEKRYRILVAEDGIYRLTKDWLEKAGVNLNGVDPRTIRLTNRGQQVPILVKGEEDGSFDKDDYIEFWGEYNRQQFQDKHEDMYKDPYSDYNVYWLSWGGSRGIRLATESGETVETDPLKCHTPHSYEFTVHAEQDRVFDRLGRVKQTCDHWFWGAIEGGRSRSFPVNLPDPDPEAEKHPTVTIMMRGKSYPEGSPDHHVLIYFNDILIADQTWDGQQLQKIVSKKLFANQLINGENILTVVLPGDPDKSAGDLDAVYLDWFEVKYPRLYKARDGYIEFSPPEDSPPGVYNFAVEGFSHPRVEVYKKGVSKISHIHTELIKDKGGKNYYQLVFQDQIGQDSAEYVAVEPEAKKEPFAIEEDEPSDLRNPENSADYLIIAPAEFTQTCERLAEFRRSQGLEVNIVKLQDIYDEFNYGLINPEAIRDFLRFTLENWRKAPTFVLLVGDGSWDYKDIYHRGNQWIPPYCSYTQKYGYTECDHLYSCLIGDDLLPDLFIGRLPVSSHRELESVIDKLIGYEASSQFGSWRRRLLFIGGLGAQFRSQSEELIASFVPPQFDASRLYVWSSSPETDPYFGGTQTLIDKIDQGLLLINFLGHGGGAIWSDALLFNCQNVGRLHNAGRLPFVISLTCFTGSFAAPHGTSLGEQFLKSENKGAIGVFGASGLGWVWHDYYLDQSLIPAFVESEGLTVGETLTRAKVQFLSQYSGSIARSMVKQCNLLGDPATKLVLPSSKLKLSLIGESSLSVGDSLRLRGTVDSACSGTAEIEVFDNSGQSLTQLSVPVEEGDFSASLNIPEIAFPGPAQLKVYVTDGQKKDWIGQVEFSISWPFVGDVMINPSPPSSSDSVRVYARIESEQGVKDVKCHFLSRDYSIPMIPTGKKWQYVTKSSLTGLLPGEEIQFYFTLTDNTGKEFTSKTFRFKVSSGTFLTLEKLFLTGQKEVQLAAEIKNAGDVSSQPAVVDFWYAGEKLGEAPLPSIAPGSSYSCGIPVQLSGGDKTIVVQIISPTTGKVEASYTREIVVNRLKVKGKTVVGADGKVRVTLPEGFKGTLLEISPLSDKFTSGQPDLIPLSFYGYCAYRICPLNSGQDLQGGDSLTVSFNIPLTDSLLAAERDNLVIAQWQPQSNLWISRGGKVDSTSISARVPRFGIFSVMVNRDHTEPTIEFSVENQHYIPGGYLAVSPRISAILKDENGINIEKIGILVDGIPADSSSFQLAGTNVYCLPVNLFTSFSPGPHTIVFTAEDASGHQASKQMDFTILPKTKVVLLGNFPNPFSEETVFAYRIDGNPLKKLTIKIYSVSGHLVRSFKTFLDDAGNPGEMSGYHELTWDGTDDCGRPLANGIYFCKVKAVLETGEKWEEIMRVAKVR